VNLFAGTAAEPARVPAAPLPGATRRLSVAGHGALPCLGPRSQGLVFMWAESIFGCCSVKRPGKFY